MVITVRGCKWSLTLVQQHRRSLALFVVESKTLLMNSWRIVPCSAASYTSLPPLFFSGGTLDLRRLFFVWYMSKEQFKISLKPQGKSTMSVQELFLHAIHEHYRPGARMPFLANNKLIRQIMRLIWCVNQTLFNNWALSWWFSWPSLILN